jgi:Methyltransferase domain
MKQCPHMELEQKPSFFEQLIQASRKLELDHEGATTSAPESAAAVRAATSGFLEGYVAYNHINLETAVNSYMETIRRYVRDIKAFLATGKYPLEIDPKQWDIGRTDYDLFLILTILVTPHRCAIMEEISKVFPQGRCLVIGVGSGVELGFINAPNGGDSYDLYINGYARQAFPQWSFHEEWYRPSDRRYSAVYAIELIEHLSEPYAFIADCHKSLAPGGLLVATTASDVPQFDHRYNFVSDEDFEDRVRALGFELELKRPIPHDYPRTDIKARNAFYVFRRNV